MWRKILMSSRMNLLCVSVCGGWNRCRCSPLHQYHADSRCGSKPRGRHTQHIPITSRDRCGPLPAPPQVAYLSAVLQALQHGQVVGPGVFGAEAGQVLPAGLLLRQLPTGRPSRLWGPSGGSSSSSRGRCILRRGICGSDDRRVGRLGRAAGCLQAEDGAEAVETQ